MMNDEEGEHDTAPRTPKFSDSIAAEATSGAAPPSTGGRSCLAVDLSATFTPGALAEKKNGALLNELTVLAKKHFKDLPDAVVANHCLGLVKLLSKVQFIHSTIQQESGMAGDPQAYMSACINSEVSYTAQRLKSLDKLLHDFHNTSDLLNREIRAFKAQITAARGKVNKMSMDADRRAVVVAALQRYSTLIETDLRAIDNTESATQEVKRYRAQLTKLFEESEQLMDVMTKLRKMCRTLVKIGVAAPTEGKLNDLWHSMLSQLNWKTIPEVTDDATKALKETKDLRFNEKRRRNDQRSRLLDVLGPVMSPTAGSPTGKEAGLLEGDQEALQEALQHIQGGALEPIREYGSAGASGSVFAADSEMFEECPESYAEIFASDASAGSSVRSRSTFGGTHDSSETLKKAREAQEKHAASHPRPQQTPGQRTRAAAPSRSMSVYSTKTSANFLRQHPSKENVLRNANGSAAPWRPGQKGTKQGGTGGVRRQTPAAGKGKGEQQKSQASTKRVMAPSPKGVIEGTVDRNL